jgi:hypothetical protein
VNQGSTVFAQVLDFLPKRQFRRYVDRYRGNHRIRSFTCFDQYLCMAFAQLTFRESLRDIECCLRAMSDKLYHMGIRGKISRSMDFPQKSRQGQAQSFSFCFSYSAGQR